METPLVAEFSSIRHGRADAGLGWMNPASDAFPAPPEVMNLWAFEPDVWIPSAHQAAPGGAIGLDELAHMDVVHGPRRVSPETCDAWLAVLRAWCGAGICPASSSRCLSTRRWHHSLTTGVRQFCR